MDRFLIRLSTNTEKIDSSKSILAEKSTATIDGKPLVPVEGKSESTSALSRRRVEQAASVLPLSTITSSRAMNSKPTSKAATRPLASPVHKPWYARLLSNSMVDHALSARLVSQKSMSQLWKTREQIVCFHFDFRGSPIKQIVFDSRGELFAVASEGGSVVIFDQRDVDAAQSYYRNISTPGSTMKMQEEPLVEPVHSFTVPSGVEKLAWNSAPSHQDELIVATKASEILFYDLGDCPVAPSKRLSNDCPGTSFNTCVAFLHALPLGGEKDVIVSRGSGGGDRIGSMVTLGSGTIDLLTGQPWEGSRQTCNSTTTAAAGAGVPDAKSSTIASSRARNKTVSVTSGDKTGTVRCWSFQWPPPSAATSSSRTKNTSASTSSSSSLTATTTTMKVMAASSSSSSSVSSSSSSFSSLTSASVSLSKSVASSSSIETTCKPLWEVKVIEVIKNTLAKQEKSSLASVTGGGGGITTAALATAASPPLLTSSSHASPQFSKAIFPPPFLQGGHHASTEADAAAAPTAPFASFQTRVFRLKGGAGKVRAWGKGQSSTATEEGGGSNPPISSTATFLSFSAETAASMSYFSTEDDGTRFSWPAASQVLARRPLLPLSPTAVSHASLSSSTNFGGASGAEMASTITTQKDSSIEEDVEIMAAVTRSSTLQQDDHHLGHQMFSAQNDEIVDLDALPASSSLKKQQQQQSHSTALAGIKRSLQQQSQGMNGVGASSGSASSSATSNPSSSSFFTGTAASRAAIQGQRGSGAGVIGIGPPSASSSSSSSFTSASSFSSSSSSSSASPATPTTTAAPMRATLRSENDICIFDLFATTTTSVVNAGGSSTILYAVTDGGIVASWDLSQMRHAAFSTRATPTPLHAWDALSNIRYHPHYAAAVSEASVAQRRSKSAIGGSGLRAAPHFTSFPVTLPAATVSGAYPLLQHCPPAVILVLSNGWSSLHALETGIVLQLYMPSMPLPPTVSKETRDMISVSSATNSSSLVLGCAVSPQSCCIVEQPRTPLSPLGAMLPSAPRLLVPQRREFIEWVKPRPEDFTRTAYRDRGEADLSERFETLHTSMLFDVVATAKARGTMSLMELGEGGERLKEATSSPSSLSAGVVDMGDTTMRAAAFVPGRVADMVIGTKDGTLSFLSDWWPQ